jgi:hypothetical protein
MINWLGLYDDSNVHFPNNDERYANTTMNYAFINEAGPRQVETV